MMPAQVVEVEPVGRDTATYWLELADPGERAAYAFDSGQFNMLYLPGLGEVPISMSSDPVDPAVLGHTVRVAGRVTSAFPRLRPGDPIGVRGPFGRPWPVRAAAGRDLLVVAGGLGLAPLRSVVLEALRDPGAFRRIVLLVGARTPEDVIYRNELEAWRRRGELHVEMTVDEPSGDWPHAQGLVTTLIEPAGLDPASTTAFVCGPERMMAAVARHLVATGVDPAGVYVSLERNMQCAVRQCGHCQLGPLFVCTDGPVFPWAQVAPWLRVEEL